MTRSELALKNMGLVYFVNYPARKCVDTLPRSTCIPVSIVRREQRTKDLHSKIPEKQTLETTATNQNMDE